jgi:hypothetical protein
LPLLDDVPHRLRRGALHLHIRRSRQNVNLFLRSPLVNFKEKNRARQGYSFNSVNKGILLTEQTG